MKKSISSGSICAPVFSYKNHSHGLWELIYYTSGEGTVTIDGVKYPFESGSIFAVPPNIVHSDSSKEGYTNLYVNFSDPDLPQAPFFSVDNPSRDIYSLLLILQREYFLHIKNHEEIMSLLLETVLSYMRVLTYAGGSTNDYVETMKKTIIDNYTNSDFTPHRIYEGLSINPDYARRLFVKEVGTTPGNFIRNMRIKKAKELLHLSDNKFTVYEIANQCGFSDQYHFSKVFKQATGSSPSAWKKRNIQ